MKASTFVKALVVLVAIGVIAYIIYNSNKAAEINHLVSAPAEQYEFTQRVDSMCDTIRKAPDVAKAKPVYDRIYEEMDVYAQIKKNDGSALIDNSQLDKLFEKAFKAYWPKIEKEAEDLFKEINWSPSQRKTLRAEIRRLVPDKKGKYNRGISKAQKDALVKYNGYFGGYERFAKLLKALENCENEDTYKSLQDLSKYDRYPYDNLTKLQKRRGEAQENAQIHWQNVLKNQWQSLYYRNVSLTKEDVQQFSDEAKAWQDRVKSYKNSTYDNYSLSQLENDMVTKYQNLIDQFNDLMN